MERPRNPIRLAPKRMLRRSNTPIPISSNPTTRRIKPKPTNRLVHKKHPKTQSPIRKTTNSKQNPKHRHKPKHEKTQLARPRCNHKTTIRKQTPNEGRTMTTQPTTNDKLKIMDDIWDAILNDAWMYGITWGQPRTGKSNLDMCIGYNVYKDWNQVLGSIVFQLNGLLHNMREGLPCRILTRNKLHNRVPYLIGDDWGANFNKAKTQHEKAMDLVKGAWDTYGTRLAVFMANMNQPDEITLQLCNKYTHEIYVPTKGEAKYDRIDWQQNYGGWQPRHNKEWLQTFNFPQIPQDVYKEYDEMRMALCDELDVLIQDAIAETETEKTIRRSNTQDIKLLAVLKADGPLERHKFQNEDLAELTESLKKAKARGLVTTIRKGTTYSYDITKFGLDILETIQNINKDPAELKKELRRTEIVLEKQKHTP